MFNTIRLHCYDSGKTGETGRAQDQRFGGLPHNGIEVNFQLGVVHAGTFRFKLIIEALPKKAWRYYFRFRSALRRLLDVPPSMANLEQRILKGYGRYRRTGSITLQEQ
jgi:hypothetical protein